MKLLSTLTAAAAALSIAFTAATPAAASPDGDDLFKFLAGAAALAIIADGLNNSSHHDYRPQPVYPRPYPQPPAYYPPVYPHPQPAPRPHHYPRPQYSGLPGACAIKIQTRNGWEKAYTADCLARAGFGRGLPQQCQRDVRGTRGWSRVYGDYCLRQAGY